MYNAHREYGRTTTHDGFATAAAVYIKLGRVRAAEKRATWWRGRRRRARRDGSRLPPWIRKPPWVMWPWRARAVGHTIAPPTSRPVPPPSTYQHSAAQSSVVTTRNRTYTYTATHTAIDVRSNSTRLVRRVPSVCRRERVFFFDYRVDIFTLYRTRYETPCKSRRCRPRERHRFG